MKIDLRQLEFIDPLLRELVAWAESLFIDEPVVTSLYRIGDDGVHGQLPLRGIDIRCRDSELGFDIEREVNAKWAYDPSRPTTKCCMFHDVGRGEHLHFQVHPNTRKR